jgi:hypothetical protein
MDTKTWMDATPPDTLHLEGGGVIPHAVGARVFNYYDHKPGTIEQTARYPQGPTMPVHGLDGGAAWWVVVRHDDGSTALLDQSRMCTINHARDRGWIND